MKQTFNKSNSTNDEILKRLKNLEKRITRIETYLTEFSPYIPFDDDGLPDERFEEAKSLVLQHVNASASLLQRRLGVGYARAARILDELENKGIVGKAEGSKPRRVLK